MKNLKPFSVIMVAALLFANIACACAPSDMSSEPPAHYHTANQDNTENTPCQHQDCDGCDELLERCTTADSSFVPADRDARTLQPKRVEVDSVNLDLAILDTGQIWNSLPAYIASQPRPTTVPWSAGTPILRKDQLTE